MGTSMPSVSARASAEAWPAPGPAHLCPYLFRDTRGQALLGGLLAGSCVQMHLLCV